MQDRNDCYRSGRADWELYCSRDDLWSLGVTLLDSLRELSIQCHGDDDHMAHKNGVDSLGFQWYLRSNAIVWHVLWLVVHCPAAAALSLSQKNKKVTQNMLIIKIYALGRQVALLPAEFLVETVHCGILVNKC